MLRNQLLQFQ